MRIKKYFLFFILSALILGGCGNNNIKTSTTNMSPKNYITQAQYNKLKIGMTKKQVIKLVGNPSSKDQNDDAIWNYDVKNGFKKDSYVELRFDGNEDPSDENHLSSKEAEGLFKQSDFTKKDSQDNSNSIDTSVFEYADNVDVSNTIATNQQVSVTVTMNKKTSPGMATQDVVNETYDFLSQDDIKNAKTVVINVKQGDNTIATFTVDKAKFVPADNIPMSDCVMKVATINFMTPEVKKFGTTMNSW